MIMYFNQCPDPLPPGMLQPGFENKVMHASFRVGGALVMASDGCDDKTKMKGISLSLTLLTEAEAKKCFRRTIRWRQSEHAHRQKHSGRLASAWLKTVSASPGW